jgi:hypothetical protein
MDEAATGGGGRQSGWASSAVRQERRDQARAVRAHKLRCGALPAPSQAELDQLVADFLARRGGVTRCLTVCVLPVQNGDGPRGRQSEAPGLLNGGPEPSP